VNIGIVRTIGVLEMEFVFKGLDGVCFVGLRFGSFGDACSGTNLRIGKIVQNVNIRIVTRSGSGLTIQ
jgi:hypothetical protein